MCLWCGVLYELVDRCGLTVGEQEEVSCHCCQDGDCNGDVGIHVVEFTKTDDLTLSGCVNVVERLKKRVRCMSINQPIRISFELPRVRASTKLWEPHTELGCVFLEFTSTPFDRSPLYSPLYKLAATRSSLKTYF